VGRSHVATHGGCRRRKGSQLARKLGVEPISDDARQRRALPARANGDGQRAASQDGRQNEVAALGVVGGVEPDLPLTCLREHLGADGGITDRHDSEVGTRDISPLVGARKMTDLRPFREGRQCRRQVWRHHGDDGPRLAQAPHFSLRNRATANDHARSPAQVHEDRIEAHHLPPLQKSQAAGHA
jgi:hypothetical protein